MLPMSRTIALKPPACSRRSVTRSACSILDHGFPETTCLSLRFGRGSGFGSKCSRSDRTLRCGSAHRGAVTSGRSKPPTASESPFTSPRGSGPKPPPCKPFFTGGGIKYFSGSVKQFCEDCSDLLAAEIPHRTQRSRRKCTPAAAADSAWRES
jgi:hypothetical protein